MQTLAPLHTLLRNRLSLAALFFCLALVRGFCYSVIVPPWQAPDEPGHLEYARLLSEKGWPLTREDISPELQREILSSMQEFDFWDYVHQPEPEQIPGSFYDDPFLRLSGTQVGDEPPLYYLVPALIFALVLPENVLIQLYVMRWFSVLLSSFVVVVAYLTAEELFHRDRFLVIGVPTFVTFLPMFTFIGASANNDSMAVLLASLFIYCLIRLPKRGITLRSALVTGLILALTLCSKKTTLFTIPLSAIAVAVYVWRPGLSRQLNRRHVIGAACLLFLAVIWGIWQWSGPEAEGWVQNPPGGRQVRTAATARTGMYSFHLGSGSSSEAELLVYVIPASTVEQIKGTRLTLRAWVRNGQSSDMGYLAIQDSIGVTRRTFESGELWTLQEVSRLISPRVSSVWVVLGAGDEPGSERTARVSFDDVALLAGAGGTPEADSLLYNGSAEFPTLRLGPLTRVVARHFSLSQLLSGDSFGRASLEKYSLYVLLAFAGFWANFGWLTMPLAWEWYALLALLALASLIGLGRGFVRRTVARLRSDPAPAPWQDRALALLFMAVSLTMLQVFLPMLARHWQPQGRYMFPALVPAAILFTVGWRDMVPTRWRRSFVVPWVAAFVALDALCVVGYLGAHYYG